MNPLKRHLFPLFAACTALAVGIALGAGPLQGEKEDSPGVASVDNAELSDQVTALEAGQVFDEYVAQAASGEWLDGTLEDASVSLIVLPGVDDERVTGLQQAINAAGGVTAVTVRIAPDFVDSAKRTYVGSVADSSLVGVDDLAKAATGETYERIGALVARAYVGSGDAVTIDDEANKIDSELQGAKLLTVNGTPARRGSLVVVLAPGGHGADVDTQATHLIETLLIAAVTRASDGVVLATPPTGADPGGLISAVLEEPDFTDLPLSTLNVDAGPAANVATVYALSATAAGKPGVFGVDGSDVMLPPGMAPAAS